MYNAGCSNLSQLNKVILGGFLEVGETSFGAGSDSLDYVDGTGDSTELAQRARMFIVKTDPTGDLAPSIKGWIEAPAAYTDAADYEISAAEFVTRGAIAADVNLLIIELPVGKARYWGLKNENSSSSDLHWWVERYKPRTQGEIPKDTLTADGIFWTEVFSVGS